MTRKARGQWFRMKFKAMLKHPRLSAEARFLWVLMESYSNLDGTGCRPSVETLMKDTGKCRKWVEKYQKELRDKGHIRVTGKHKTKKGAVNVYQINYPLTFHYGKKKEGTIPPEMPRTIPPEMTYDRSSIDRNDGDNSVREEPPIYALPDPQPEPAPPTAATA